MLDFCYWMCNDKWNIYANERCLSSSNYISRELLENDFLISIK